MRVKFIAQTSFTNTTAIEAAMSYIDQGVNHVSDLIMAQQSPEAILLWLLGGYDGKDIAPRVLADAKAPEIASVFHNFNMMYLIECSTVAGIMLCMRRGLVPIKTKSGLIYSGSLRNWIRYCETVDQIGIDLEEHKSISESLKIDLIDRFPTITKALGWIPQTT